MSSCTLISDNTSFFLGIQQVRHPQDGLEVTFGTGDFSLGSATEDPGVVVQLKDHMDGIPKACLCVRVKDLVEGVVRVT